MKIKFKSENAAVSLLVLITILTFVTILTGAIMAVTTLTKSQLESDIRLQEIYGKDVDRVDEIYEEIISADNKSPTCKIETEVMNDTNAKYTFNFNKDVMSFDIEKIELYNGLLLSTSVGENFTLSSSVPAVSTNLEVGKKYVISFDYKCTSKKNNFEFGLYQDDTATQQVQNLETTVEERHAEYIMQTQSDGFKLKFKANIADSNNITITNLKVVQVEEEAKKGNFVKVDGKTYTLVTFIEQNMEQIVILQENSFIDSNDNGNVYSIKMLEKD